MKKNVRTRLVEARKRQGWSQHELATRLGTTPHNISRWEAGRTTPGPYFRAKLCELFGMSIQELLLLESNALPMRAHEDEVVTQLFLDFKQNARQAALTGDWSGTARDEERGREFHLTLQLQSTGRTLRGEGHLRGATQNGDRTQSVTVSGRLVYDRFLKLEYTLGEPLGAIQFGFILLEFAPDGQALRGGFVGYGALVTTGIVTGTVHLQRQGVQEMQNETIEV